MVQSLPCFSTWKDNKESLGAQQPIIKACEANGPEDEDLEVRGSKPFRHLHCNENVYTAMVNSPSYDLSPDLLLCI